jgi:hypothetical protein
LVGAVVHGYPGAGDAFGQTPANAAAPSSDAGEAARLLGEGMAAGEAGDWERARALFARAYSLHKHWKIAVNLARAEVRLGRLRDAGEHLEYYLNNVPSNAVAPRDLEEMQRLRDEVGLKVPTVKVVVDVPGTEVLVDGQVKAKSPVQDRLYLEPGRRVIEVRREGYAPQKEVLDLAPGMTKRLTYVMEPAAPAREPSRDERDPWEDTTPLPKPQYSDAAGEMPGWQKTFGWLGVGLGAAGIVAGGVLVVQSVAKNGEAAEVDRPLREMTTTDTEKCAEALMAVQPERKAMCDSLTSLTGKRNALYTGGLISVASGVTLAAAGVLIWSLAVPSEETGAAFRVVPTVSGSRGGVLLLGQF